jgi:hypothetical protein
MPTFDGGDNFVGVGGPHEGLRLGIGLCDEAVALLAGTCASMVFRERMNS